MGISLLTSFMVFLALASPPHFICSVVQLGIGMSLSCALGDLGAKTYDWFSVVCAIGLLIGIGIFILCLKLPFLDLT